MKYRLMIAAAIAIVIGAPTSATESSYEFSTQLHVLKQLREGRNTFRYATFGDEAFWGDGLGLHLAVAGAANGGVGPGVSPATALAVGLKVDVDALPRSVQRAIARGKIDLADPAVTLELLKLDAVVGVTGIFDEKGRVTSMGIQCALCHSTVDDSLTKGIGRRRDGWANRDLNIGAIVALAPRLEPVATLLGTDVATVRAVLTSWGPGRFDASLFIDGRAFRPDGKSGVGDDPPGVRTRRSQPAHVDRLGWCLALECFRGESRDAREGHVLRSQARRRHALSDRGT